MNLQPLKKQLKEAGDATYDFRRFFKEPIDAYGVPYKELRRIAKKSRPNIPKEELFKVCETLMQGKHEEFIVAVDWLFAAKDELKNEDFPFLEHLLSYTSNWSQIDDYCPKVIHHMIVTYPERIPEVKDWTSSKNRWVRRASCVSFLNDSGGARPTVHELDHIFDVCKRLLKDEDDLVRKGYGWLLKNASKRHQKEVFTFVMNHKKDMPRVSLRYAIELMPARLKKQAMA